MMKNKNKRIDLFKHIRENAKEKDIYLDFINGVEDHVHCLISLACDQNIAQCVKLLKETANIFSAYVYLAHHRTTLAFDAQTRRVRKDV